MDESAQSPASKDTALGAVHCIVIEGTDARAFAQAQFSGDVEALRPDRWQWNAWLDPRGRVRLLMHLANPGDGRLLAVLRGGDAEAACAALKRYILRSKVILEPCVFSGRAGPALPEGVVRAESGGVVLGYGERSLRLLPVSPEVPARDPDATRTWHRAEIAAGWPSLPAGEPEFLPPALGLEHLGAVAFDKGCYPGQEIAARLHYRGGHKRRLYRVRSARPLQNGGAIPNGAEAAMRVIAITAAGDDFEALIVMEERYELEINGLNHHVDVVHKFEP